MSDQVAKEIWQTAAIHLVLEAHQQIQTTLLQVQDEEPSKQVLDSMESKVFQADCIPALAQLQKKI